MPQRQVGMSVSEVAILEVHELGMGDGLGLGELVLWNGLSGAQWELRCEYESTMFARIMVTSSRLPDGVLRYVHMRSCDEYFLASHGRMTHF